MIEVGQIGWVIDRDRVPNIAVLGRVALVDFAEFGVRVETGLSRKVATKFVFREDFDPLDVVSLVGTLNRSCPFCRNGLVIQRVDDYIHKWPNWPEWIGGSGSGWSDRVERVAPQSCRCVSEWTNSATTGVVTFKVGQTASNWCISEWTGQTGPPGPPAQAGTNMSQEVPRGFRAPTGRRPPPLTPEKLRSLRHEQRRRSQAMTRRPPRAR